MKHRSSVVGFLMIDAVIKEVYASHQAISTQHGDNSRRYIAALRKEVAMAAAKGISYVDYCLFVLNGQQQAVVD